MTPTSESSPIRRLGQRQDSVSLEVTSRGMGRPFTYSVQFVAPCLVRYYMPGVRSRDAPAPHTVSSILCFSQLLRPHVPPANIYLVWGM